MVLEMNSQTKEEKERYNDYLQIVKEVSDEKNVIDLMWDMFGSSKFDEWLTAANIEIEISILSEAKREARENPEYQQDTQFLLEAIEEEFMLGNVPGHGDQFFVSLVGELNLYDTKENIIENYINLIYERY